MLFSGSAAFYRVAIFKMQFGTRTSGKCRKKKKKKENSEILFEPQELHVKLRTTKIYVFCTIPLKLGQTATTVNYFFH